MSKLHVNVAVVLALSVYASQSSAGGLFGKGGLIRGDIGNVLDRTIETPVLTPIAKTLAVLPNLAPIATTHTLREAGEAGEEVSEAPSGNEQSVIFSGNKAVMVIPGRDSPADGLNFDQGEFGNAHGVNDFNSNNARIIYEK